MEDDSKAVGPSIPFRPLPKIMPRINFRVLSPGKIQLGTKIHVKVIPKSVYARPFWRTYEVVSINGSKCRLVTEDKKFMMIEKVDVVEKLLEVENNA